MGTLEIFGETIEAEKISFSDIPPDMKKNVSYQLFEEGVFPREIYKIPPMCDEDEGDVVFVVDNLGDVHIFGLDFSQIPEIE